MRLSSSESMVPVVPTQCANPVLHLWQADGSELLGQALVIEDSIEGLNVPVECQASTSVSLRSNCQMLWIWR